MIYTSCFSNIKGVLGKKPNIRFCSIAGKTPEWFLEYDRKLELKSFSFKNLMPKYDWWKEWDAKFNDNHDSEESIEWYRRKYSETVLDVLNLNIVIENLYELSENNDVCLLCYEKPENFCHRHLVSEWFVKNGIDCKEI